MVSSREVFDFAKSGSVHETFTIPHYLRRALSQRPTS
jgi:hypothetical protein